ncbi:MAG TPA: hypothetical protein VLX68_05165 [Chitinivibrionales bacterium]|nr:hypothetical protein [Chitinivibrionales bacterium]
MSYELRFLLALAVTVVTETAVIFILIRALWKSGASSLSNARILFAGIFASSATLPYLWFILPALVKPYIVQVVTGEIGVVMVEAAFYYFTLNVSAKKAGILSLVANAASIVIGLVIFR